MVLPETESLHPLAVERDILREWGQNRSYLGSIEDARRFFESAERNWEWFAFSASHHSISIQLHAWSRNIHHLRHRLHRNAAQIPNVRWFNRSFALLDRTTRAITHALSSYSAMYYWNDSVACSVKGIREIDGHRFVENALYVDTWFGVIKCLRHSRHLVSTDKHGTSGL